MGNDFLASWREETVPRAGPVGTSHQMGRDAGNFWGKDPRLDERHRTVGVSMSPKLREEAAVRARALGLPFSRYVAWCVEAELEGRPPQARFARPAGRVGKREK